MTEIKLTLGSIRAANPCSNEWETKALEYLHEPWIDTREVTFADIVASCGLEAGLFCLRCLPENERWRMELLARSYALHVAHLWKSERAMLWLVKGDTELRAGVGIAADAAGDAAYDVAYAADAAYAAYAAYTAYAVAAAAAYAADAAYAAADAAAYAAAVAAAYAAHAAERSWQTTELLRIMSLDYSPEALILEKPEAHHE